MLFEIFLYAISGVLAGLLSGMLGVGGGSVIVPMLLLAFSQLSVSPEISIHLALGTSLASIIFTSFSSAYAQHKRKAVDWSIVRNIVLGICVGTYLGSIVVAKLPAIYLQIIFALFLLFVSYRTVINNNPKANASIPSFKILNLFGIAIGFISSLVGIGGGTLSVPFMLWHNVEMRKAIATSSAIGIFIAISGAIGFYVNGLNAENLPPYSAGFIYLPALACIVVFSMIFAPLGVRLVHSMPVKRIKQMFALLLFLLALKMLFEAF